MSRLGVIEETAPNKCELCGKVAELRPYGPRGENVCFDCAMLNEAAAKRQFSKLVIGENIQ